MIVMQKLKFMQELTSAINAECLHSSLQAKLLMHVYKCNKHRSMIYRISQKPRNDRKIKNRQVPLSF